MLDPTILRVEDVCKYFSSSKTLIHFVAADEAQSNVKILLVDDNQMNLQVIRKLLNVSKYLSLI